MKIKLRGFCDYQLTLQQMQTITGNRTAQCEDELWLLQHPPVYTLGQSGGRRHIRTPGAIPVVQSDRGGMATYHGPGQVVAYLLLDVRRMQLGARALVRKLQEVIAQMLAGYGIDAEGNAAAPGVYVGGKKIAALGLRVRRGCCYHGVSLNVAMDLSPFDGIDVCGYAGMQCTQMSDFGFDGGAEDVMPVMARHLRAAFDSDTITPK